jgi:hypothetical protein
MKLNLNLVDFRKFDTFDILLLAVFVIYIVFPVETPSVIVPFVESPLGLVVLFAATVSLFVYKNPILGVLFIFVSYELLRRTHHNAPASPIVNATKHMVNRVPTEVPNTQVEKDVQMIMMNPAVEKTLEEEVVAKEAPVGKSHVPVYTESSFQPVADRSDLGMSMV